MTLAEAKLHLRVDFDDDDVTIQTLIMAAESYLENATGKKWNEEPIEPLAKLTAKLLLGMWYEHESGKEKKLIGLLSVLSAMGRESA